LSHDLWQRRFGADPAALGREIRLNGIAHRILGVMPVELRYPPNAELWVPLAMDAQERALRGSHYLETVARLRPGVSLQQANAEMASVGRRIAELHPFDHARRDAAAGLLREHVSGELTARYTVLLLSAVGFVLLIACCNVANLLITRITARSKEFAVRAVLGASRLRIARQLLTESVLLSLGGGLLGLLFALWGLDAIRSGMPEEVAVFLPGWGRVGMNPRALGFTVIVASLSGILAGVLPALFSARANLNETLKVRSRGQISGPGHHRAPNLLVVAQMVLAMVLLVGAGIMVKGFSAILEPAPNLQPENVLSVRVTLAESSFPEKSQRAAFASQWLEQLSTIAGAEQSALVTNVAYSGSRSSSNFEIEGRPVPQPGETWIAQMQSVSEGYFRTIQVPLLTGRDFTARDADRAQQVAIISESLARRYFPGEDPIGKRLLVGGAFERSTPWAVVGVVGDILHYALDRAPRPVIYRPIRQVPPFAFHAVVRAPSDPMAMLPAVRDALRKVNPDVPLFQAKTWAKMIRDQLTGQWYVANLLAVFGIMALLFSCVGVYSVLATSVSERTHEIGVRMALGAQRREVLWVFLRRGLLLTLVGMAIGLAAAMALGRALANLVYGVSTTDVGALLAVTLTLTGVALLACWIPARRATRVDPMVALRYE
jgi:putative ABC transport system permease protein